MSESRKFSTRLYLAIGLGFIVSIVTSILLSQDGERDEAVAAAEPTMLIKQGEFTRQGKNGVKLSGAFTSAKGYMPDYQEFDLEAPRFVMFENGHEAWQLTADTGKIKRSAESLLLQGGFKAKSLLPESDYIFIADEAWLMGKEKRLTASSNLKVFGNGVELTADRIELKTQ